MIAKYSDIRSDERACLGIARAESPFKTGNVRYNATKSAPTNDGFVITHSIADAFYIYFLQEGTRYTQKHKNYIGNIALSIAEYLNAKYVAENEAQVGNFKQIAKRGNYDYYKRYDIQPFMERRERQHYESRLVDMVNYGHMSNEYGWESTAENIVPDKFRERK